MLIPLGFLAASGAESAAYELITTSLVTGTQSSVSLNVSGFESSYTHLQIRYSSLGDSSSFRYRLRLNADTASNYSTHLLYGNGSSALAAGASTTEIALGTGTSTANIYTVGVVDILDAFNTSKYKTVKSFNGVAGNEISLTTGNWRSTSPITSVSIRPDAGNLVAGGRFSIYGLRTA